MSQIIEAADKQQFAQRRCKKDAEKNGKIKLETGYTIPYLGSMTINPFAPDFKNLPETLPIFPLDGVLLLPGGKLPLNIFEPRYLEMAETSLSSHRMIGMVQPKTNLPKKNGNSVIYTVGCAGKITEFVELEDGRYLITLSGIARFKIEEELTAVTRFRQVKPDWTDYKADLTHSDMVKIDREQLKELLSAFFAKNNMQCDWEAVEKTDDASLITILSMACPLNANEKQALLEAPTHEERTNILMTLLEIAIKNTHEVTPKQ